MKTLNRTLTLCLAAALGLTVTLAAHAGTEQVRIATSEGDILVALDGDAAPNSVANFLAYVDDGAYDSTIFHRVIDGFMVQGGGFDENYEQRPTRAPIENEADNGLENRRGTIAMARTQDPHSATNQFFINLVNNDFLDHRAPNARGWGYAVFGRVVEGMSVVDAIGATPTGAAGPFPQDAPVTPVVIKRVERHDGPLPGDDQ